MRKKMILFQFVLLGVAFALFLYLFAALIWPERF